MKKRHEQKLLVLAFGLALVFNVPFVLILTKNIVILGVPFFYFAIFFIWLFSILFSFYVLNKYYE